MGWRQTDPVNERRQLIDAWVSGDYSKSELAARFGVSRPTVDRCIGRFRDFGDAGLEPQTHTPKSCPHRTEAALEELIVSIRRKHPTWGPVHILQRLELKREHYGLTPEQTLPASSTVGTILQRNGLIVARPARPKLGSLARERTLVAVESNEVWTIDFKGEFRTGDGIYCYPLTLQDAYSRYVLVISAQQGCHGAAVRTELEGAFRDYGLPAAMHSDNGNPFASMGRWRLSVLSVWWIELGIAHQLSRPRCPQDNPRHERMHRTLKDDTTRPPAADRRRQQERFDCFRSEYNQQRPHQGIGGKTPSMLYTASPRELPSRIAAPEYAGHCEQRVVHRGGEIRFKGEVVFISQTLASKRLALEEIDDGIWQIWFYQTPLGRYNERTQKVH
jgi:putative transposase